MIKGVIYDFKRFALHDGPGIRTTVFLKGCPLDCWWCHNPESRSGEIQNAIHHNKLDDVLFEHEVAVGKEYSVEEAIIEIEKDIVFYEESGGGVTFSGGEPLQQSEFLLNLISECSIKGIHTAVDTSGFAESKLFLTVLDEADLFLADVKSLDDTVHKKYTGVSNTIILKNIRNVPSEKLILRYPLVPGINDRKLDAELLSKFVNDCNPLELHILPYHNTASSKYKLYNMVNRMGDLTIQDENYVNSFIKCIDNTDTEIIVGG